MEELRKAHYEQAEEATDSSDAKDLLQTLRNIELSSPPQRVLDQITEALEGITEAPKYCEYQTTRVTLETPAEYCDEITIVGSDYCKKHD